MVALEDGRRIERHLARGDDHRYQLALIRGERAQLVAAQRGIDLVVQTFDPNDVLIAEFDDEIRRDGEEQIDLVAETSGSYTVAIRASSAAIDPGLYTIRLAGRSPATDGDRSMQDSRRLRTLAGRFEEAGRFHDARPLLERALSLSEGVRGRDDADVGLLLFRLAGNALETRDDARAQLLVQRAIDVFEKTAGTDHPYTAIARSELAQLYEHAGQEPRAEALLRPALAMIEKTLGADHLWYARGVLTEAGLRFDAGDLDRADELDRSALAILERLDQTETIPYAAALNSLGEIAWRRHETTRAEELFRRSLAIAEKLYGPESYRASTSLQDLGIIARERKDYATALEYDTRALSIRQQILGPDHPDIAPLLNNLAILYRLTGDNDRALLAHFRALEIWERTLGPYHRGTLTSVGNIARTYASMGDIPNAIAFERRADAILEKQLALNVAVGSERQKLAFVRSVAERTDRTISLHLEQAPTDRDAAALAALVILQRKGRVQDAMADVFASVRQRIANPQDRTLLDRLNETTARLAQVALDTRDQDSPAERQETLAELEARKEQLEATLSEHSAEFRAQTRPVTLDAVNTAIPEDAALLEFAVFRPFDAKAEQNAEAYGPPRYAAYVLRRHAAPTGVDLGDAGAIDRAIATFRDALRDPSRADVNVRARALDEQVMRRLRASLAGVKRLIISPDGRLNLVPFEALVDERGRFLIEHYAISYVTSGRDLLRMQIRRAVPTAPVIIADPLFGEPAPEARVQPVGALAGPAAARRTVSTLADRPAAYFAPLGATGMEARAIKALFPEATLLTGREASKVMLQQVNAPRILHIASHGYFLDDAVPAAGANPLLRSGLALAGANLSRDGQGDGILTALEASGLDLWGTKLVTLSACDTGVGEIRDGEGVYGLRRAFMLAGAETVVMSLWPVSDYLARDAMVAYYAGLRVGFGRGDALRRAKLAMLKRPGRRHPYYWAGFIQSGDWGDLDGRR